MAAERLVDRVAERIEHLIDERPMVDAPHSAIRKIMAQKIARVAIEAMREPTDTMAWHGYFDAEHTLEAMEHIDHEESCANIYRAMIDAALK